jgi:hypothetical protein
MDTFRNEFPKTKLILEGKNQIFERNLRLKLQIMILITFIFRQQLEKNKSPCPLLSEPDNGPIGRSCLKIILYFLHGTCGFVLLLDLKDQAHDVVRSHVAIHPRPDRDHPWAWGQARFEPRTARMQSGLCCRRAIRGHS